MKRDDLPLRQRFRVPRFTDHGVQEELVEAVQLSVSARVAVYVAVAGVQRRPAETAEQRAAAEICRVLEERVLPAVEAWLEPVCDVDGNGALTVVIADLDRRQRIPHSGGDVVPVRGCVRASDFLADDADFGGDLIFLDEQLLTEPDSPARELLALLAHETAHAAVYSACRRQKLSLLASTDSSSATGLQVGPERWVASPQFAGPTAAITTAMTASAGHRQLSARQEAARAASLLETAMPGWLNEAIAHCVERRLVPESRNFEARLVAFHQQPALCPVMAGAGLSPMARRGGTRAAATLFVESLLPEPRRLSLLLDLQVPPVQRLEQLGGQSFSQLFRLWSCGAVLQLAGSADTQPAVDARTGETLASVETSHLGHQVLPPLVSDSWQQSRLRGTAVMCYHASATLHDVIVEGPTAAQLQVTLLLPADVRCGEPEVVREASAGPHLVAIPAVGGAH